MTTRAITTPEQLALAVARLGRRLQLVTNRRARLNARKARHEDQLTTIKAQLAALDAKDGLLIERDAVAIFARVFPNWKQYSTTHTADLKTGTAELITRKAGAMVFPNGEEAAIDEIRAKFPRLAPELIKTVETIRKDPLKNDYPEVLAELLYATAPGVKTFAIRPDNCTRPYVLPVARLTILAIEQGLIPDPASETTVAP